MQVRAADLSRHLACGLAPLYVITGDEPLLVMEAVDAIRAAAVTQGYTEREVLTVEGGFRWTELAARGASLSLFAARRMLELRIPGGKPGVEGAAALEAYCASLPPHTLTVITLPRVNRRAAQASWFQALAHAGMVVDIAPVELEQLPDWLAERLARQGQSADAQTLRFLAEQVEGNLLAAHQEVQKLGLLYPPRRLSFEEVSEAVLDVSRYDVFQLADAMLAGQVARLARILDALAAAGEKPVPVLGVLAWAIRGLARARAALDRGVAMEVALREAGFWGSRQQLARRALAKLSAGRLAAALGWAAEVDRMSKGLAAGDVWDGLLQLALRIARPA
ncbi:DNA polymerase III subunit delta [Thiobacter aerophilum]|uniref:DNA polymerase III subunit delta n=1 Tax=Thiobacter aerophilum TaxID=3121275 RepID=A0ABV0EFZ8_9BURK